jgi:hypothetical protein
MSFGTISHGSRGTENARVLLQELNESIRLSPKAMNYRCGDTVEHTEHSTAAVIERTMCGIQ